MKKLTVAVLTFLLALAPAALADDFSFTGSFTQDDDVQVFSFSVGVASVVTLRTWSYAGGTNAAGDSIAQGGFDPILALFDSTGALIDQNDDGGCGLVAADSETGSCWDTYFSELLAAGTYYVSVSQYNNFANGLTLSDGFFHDGDGNFTASFGNCSPAQFIDVSNDPGGECRDGHWAFDILNVGQAEEIPRVPEPASMVLLGSGLLAGGLRRLRSKKS